MLNIDFSKNRHAFYKLNYTLVVSTYNNCKIITDKLEKSLKYVILQNFKQHNCELVDVKIEDQSKVTINFTAPPHIKLSVLVNNFKTVSSRLIRKEFQKYLESKGIEKHMWKMEYYIFT